MANDSKGSEYRRMAKRRINYAVNWLRHHDGLKTMARGEIPPAPIMVDVDLCGACNLNCKWCCQAHWRFGKKSGQMLRHAVDSLPAFLARWGVKSVRLAGEGEPCMAPELSSFITSLCDLGIWCGLITNGTLLRRVDVQSLRRLSYLGISLDAGTAERWGALKQAPKLWFGEIVNNVRWIRESAPDLPVTIKFLRYNRTSLAANEYGGGPEHGAVENVNEEGVVSGLAETLGCDVRIKDAYPRNYPATYRFRRCRAAPIGGVFCSNLNFQLCCDRRGTFTLVDDFTDYNGLLTAWGGSKHRELLASINPEECLGCCKRDLNETLENVLQDGPWTSEMQVEFV